MKTMYKILVAYNYKRGTSSGVGRAVVTTYGLIEDEESLSDIENTLKENIGYDELLISNVNVLSTCEVPCDRTEELELATTKAVEWVKKYLNPDQQLIITYDGIKVTSDELFLPLEVED